MDFLSIKKSSSSLKPQPGQGTSCPGVWQPRPPAEEPELWQQARMSCWHPGPRDLDGGKSATEQD